MSRLRRDRRLLDRLLAAVLLVGGAANVIASPERQGPVVANLALIALMALSLLWRRARPLVPVVCIGIAMPVFAAVFTAPPHLFSRCSRSS